MSTSRLYSCFDRQDAVLVACSFCLLFPSHTKKSFVAEYMNQGGALVHVYLDGTVLVSHGGTEMGQGLHTKVCQVVANEFGIDVEKVMV